MLSGLVNEDAGQQELQCPAYPDTRQQKLMETVDRYNAKAGEGKIKLASEGTTKPTKRNGIHEFFLGGGGFG